MTCLRTFYFIPFILLSFLSLSVLSTSVFARSFDDIIESKKINIAVYNDYPPYSYMEAGSAKGIDVDIAKEIAAKKLEKELEPLKIETIKTKLNENIPIEKK